MGEGLGSDAAGKALGPRVGQREIWQGIEGRWVQFCWDGSTGDKWVADDADDEEWDGWGESGVLIDPDTGGEWTKRKTCRDRFRCVSVEGHKGLHDDGFERWE